MIDKNATVGIIMTAYNQGRYIDDAIESLKEQTFQDFIVHIVDDGSNDKYTPKKLKSIKYDKAVLFLNTENRGEAYRKREHSKKLKTKYIMAFDADDIIDPTFLEKTVKYMEEHRKCAIVSTNIVELKAGKKFEVEMNKEKMNLKYMLSKCYCLGSSLMRKEALDGADLSGGFKRYQDWDRFVAILKNGWEAGLVPEYLYYYRQHSDSLSHSATVEEEMETKRKMLKKYDDLYQKYYKDVILDIYHELLVVQKSKDWLDDQYFWHLKEIEKLRKELKWSPVFFAKRVIGKIKRTLGKKK